MSRLIFPICATVLAAGWTVAVVLSGSFGSVVLAGIAGLLLAAVVWMWIEFLRSPR